jgi:hypothetical protein
MYILLFIIYEITIISIRGLTLPITLLSKETFRRSGILYSNTQPNLATNEYVNKIKIPKLGLQLD